MSSDEFSRGIRRFQKKLEQIGDRAADLDGLQVPLTELFAPAFMERYTDHETLEAMISAGEFSAGSADDFLAIPDDEWERHVAATTQFDNWLEMQSKAGAEWAAARLRV